MGLSDGRESGERERAKNSSHLAFPSRGARFT
jgi:hypothetical protein